MRSRTFVVGAVLVVAGCAEVDMPNASSFASTAGGFVFETKMIGDAYPGEQYRVEYLDSLVQANNVCPNGYDITDRHEVLYPGVLKKGQINYFGRCR